MHITVSREQENQTEALVEGEGHVREAEQVDILCKRIRDIGIGAKMWMCPMPGWEVQVLRLVGFGVIVPLRITERQGVVTLGSYSNQDGIFLR